MYGLFTLLEFSDSSKVNNLNPPIENANWKSGSNKHNEVVRSVMQRAGRTFRVLLMILISVAPKLCQSLARTPRGEHECRPIENNSLQSSHILNALCNTKYVSEITGPVPSSTIV
jgi:hypothetical protein